MGTRGSVTAGAGSRSPGRPQPTSSRRKRCPQWDPPPSVAPQGSPAHGASACPGPAGKQFWLCPREFQSFPRHHPASFMVTHSRLGTSGLEEMLAPIPYQPQLCQLPPQHPPPVSLCPPLSPQDELSRQREYKYFIAAVLGHVGHRGAGTGPQGWAGGGVHVPVTGCCPEKQRGTEGAITSLAPLSCHWLCHQPLGHCCASQGSSALLLQPLHPQDLAQEPLHVLVHVALGWRGHWWGHQRGHQGLSVRGPSAPGSLDPAPCCLPHACGHWCVAGWCPSPPDRCPQFLSSHVPTSPALRRAGGSGTASPPCCAAFLSPARERVGLSRGPGACRSPEPPR